MKVLITGGAGFIGHWLIKRCYDAGWEPVVFDPRRRVNPMCEFRLGDVRDATSVDEAVGHVDGVIHLAAVLGSQETVQNPRPAIETNLMGTINVFESCVHHDVPVVYAAVGNHWLRTLGAGGYTITKEAANDFAAMYREYRGLWVNVVRPMNAFGPWQSVAAPYGTSRVRKIVPSFIVRAIVEDAIEVYGDGSQISDCVYVEDVAKHFVAALGDAYDGVLHPTIEVGPEEHHTVLDIARLIRGLVIAKQGYAGKIKCVPMRPGEVAGVTTADPGTRPFGFPIRPLAEALSETVDWFMATEGSHWRRPRP